MVPPGHTFLHKYNFKPIEGNLFEVKMTNVFHHIYNIESNIEGKHLLEFLLSYKPSLSLDIHAYCNMKNLASKSNAKNLEETQNTKLDISYKAKYFVESKGI